MLINESCDSFAAILNKQAKKILNDPKTAGNLFSNIKPLNYSPIISKLKQGSNNINKSLNKNSSNSSRNQSKDLGNDLNKLTPLHLAKEYINTKDENEKSNLINSNKDV
jgi:hypothetical protein